MKDKRTTKPDGFAANSFVVPLIVILAILYGTIVALVYDVNHATNSLTDSMNQSIAYQNQVTELQAGASKLSETMTSFISMPVNDEGALNVGYLIAYSGELTIEEHRGPYFVEQFKQHNVSSAVQTFLNDAAAKAQELIDLQIHALSLMRSIYALPPIPALTAIPSVPLTEEEEAMTPAQRIETAKQLMLDTNYSSAKVLLNQNATNCTKTIQDEFAKSAVESEEHIQKLRVALWSVIIGIIAISIVTFIFFFHWLIMPLRRYSNLIASDQNLKKQGGIRELRLMAGAYNELLFRRNKLETILRSAAETDALTGMPNRYSLECNLLERNESGGPMAVVLFDVNYLKRVNDTQGHLAGDKLIQTTGSCICECFSKGNAGNCYRIGGDEFAAILRDCSEEEIKTRVDHFNFAIEREHISVSVGYAYATESDENSFKKLMRVADKRMYEQKRQTHEKDKDSKKN